MATRPAIGYTSPGQHRPQRLSGDAIMSETLSAIRKFVEYGKACKGDEKSEAQLFCDQLFQAFGHAGCKQAGAELESRLKKKGGGARFIDLLWKPRLLLEMKKRGENLQKALRAGGRLLDGDSA